MGTLYLRGKTWWIKYYHNGEMVRESSGSGKKMIAKELLAKREAELVQGQLPGVYFERVTLKQIMDDMLADYRINELKSLKRAEQSTAHLLRIFKHYTVLQVTTPRINSYIIQRLDEGAARATINRELSALKRAMNLGAKQTPPIVSRVPHIPLLKENNVRTGFFEHEDFLVFREALPPYLREFVTFAYKTGWRRSEVCNLKWAQVDLKRGTASLNPGTTKNNEGRLVFLDEELKGMLKRLHRNRSSLLPWVFLNEKGDDKIKQFHKTWRAACLKTKIGQKIFHDLRRTAVRNMVRSGTPEAVVMKISGHKTRLVFDRYNIVSEEDLRAAAFKQEAHLQQGPQKGLGTI